MKKSPDKELTRAATLHNQISFSYLLVFFLLYYPFFLLTYRFTLHAMEIILCLISFELTFHIEHWDCFQLEILITFTICIPKISFYFTRSTVGFFKFLTRIFLTERYSIHLRLQQMLKSNWSSLIYSRSVEEKKRRNKLIKTREEFLDRKEFHSNCSFVSRESWDRNWSEKSCVLWWATWGRRVFFSCERKTF